MLQWAPRKAVTSILLAGFVAVGGSAAIAADPANRRYVDEVEKSGLAELQKNGMQVVSGVDTVDFQKRLEPVFRQYGARFGDPIARIRGKE
jgi:TRAP-type C4-dicarboxylate transport system substrate-binding protein